MVTILTFEEELAVSNAVSLRIRSVSETIDQARALRLDVHVLCEIRQTLLDAYRKITGVDYKLNN